MKRISNLLMGFLVFCIVALSFTTGVQEVNYDDPTLVAYPYVCCNYASTTTYTVVVVRCVNAHLSFVSNQVSYTNNFKRHVDAVCACVRLKLSENEELHCRST